MERGTIYGKAIGIRNTIGWSFRLVTLLLILTVLGQAFCGGAEAKPGNNRGRPGEDPDPDNNGNWTGEDTSGNKVPLADVMAEISAQNSDNGSDEEGFIQDEGMEMQMDGMMEGGGLTDDDTIAYYNFDDPDEPEDDDSGNGRDLTLGSGDDEPDGAGNTPCGRCLYFDGEDDYAYRAGSDFDTSTSITIEMCIFAKGQDIENKVGTLADRYEWSAGKRIFNLYLRTDNKLSFTVWDDQNDDTTVVSDNAISVNEWHCIAASFDGGTKKLLISVDGIEDGSETASTGTLKTNQYVSLKIGDNTLKGSGSNPLLGFIDEVRISDAARGVGDTVGFWNFNENTDGKVRDRSSQGLADGTIYGATLSDGRYGKSLLFDGSNDYVSIPADSRLHVTGPMTIEAWVKYGGPATSTGTVDTIIAQRGHFWIHVPRFGDHQGKVVFESGNSPWGPDVRSSSTLSIGVWTHIAFVRTSSTYVKIYINGVLDAQGSTYSPSGISENLIVLGSWSSSIHNFKGCIDELRISNYDKTLEGDFRYGGDALELPFEGTNWDGGEANGILDDRSPLDNDMTTKHGGTSQSDDGKYGKCISLDGDGDYVKMNSDVPNSLNPATLTVEAWIYPTEIKLAGIVDNSNSWGAYTKGGYVLRLRSDGKIQFFFYKNGTDTESVTSSDAVAVDKWWHVAGVYDGKNLRVYIDGVCQGTTDYEGSIYYGKDWGLYVGSGYIGDKEFFNGRIDEVRVANHPRTFHEDTDGDGMTDKYEIMRSKRSDQYDPMENNGRHALLIAPRPQDLGQQNAYWNDPKFMYDVLKSYGYLDFDIHFLYNQGSDVKSGDYGTPTGVTYTDGAATPAQLASECTDLWNIVLEEDFFFVYAFGPGYRNAVTNHSYLTLNDGEGGHTYLQDSTFAGATYIGKINSYRYRAFFLQPVYGGGFVNDLSNTKTVIATACAYDEGAYLTSGDGDENQGENGEFDFYFMSGLASQTPTNHVHIDADETGGETSLISLYESYQWDVNNEDRPEHPQIDDDGNALSQQDGDHDDGENLADELYL